MTGDPYVYREGDWPHGLKCARCPHVFSDGERYSSLLTAFQDDVPVTLLVCPACARGEGAS